MFINYCIVQNLEGENFGDTVHTKNWQIILWQMPKIAQAPKMIIRMLTFCQPIETIGYSCGVWLK